MKVTSVFIVVLGVSLDGQQLERLPAQAAAQAVGRVAMVCGEVMELGCHAPDPAAALTFLTASSMPAVSIVIAPPDRSRFGVTAGDRLRPRRACVTGAVESVAGGLHIVVNRDQQLVFEDEIVPVQPSAEPLHRSCDRGVVHPKVLRDVKPQYTPDAMRNSVHGRILLQAIVDTDGVVQDAQVIRALDPGGLDSQALDALRQWRFEPGRVDGQPAPVVITVTMDFTLWTKPR